MNRRKIIIVIVAFLVIATCYFFGLLPVVSESKNDIIVEEINLNKYDQFNPFSQFNFNDEDFQLYYIQSFEEKAGLSKVLYTDDKETLLKIKKSFNCTYTDGDISTYESRLVLIKDNKVVLRMYIKLQGQPYGVQNSEFGWLTFKEREKASEAIKGMKSYLTPFLSI